MNYLAIDTSGANLTILLRIDDKDYKYYDQSCGVNHSVQTMVQLENLLESANVSLGEVDFIAVVVGAGSFTGIRIGISTAKALCFAYKKPILAITSFDCLAYNVKNGKVLAVIDAKHNGFYVCGYSDGKVCLQPKYILINELKSLSSEYKLVSSTLLECECSVVESVAGLRLAIEEKRGEVTADLDLVQPLYVRKSQAEEGR